MYVIFITFYCNCSRVINEIQKNTCHFQADGKKEIFIYYVCSFAIWITDKARVIQLFKVCKIKFVKNTTL